MAGPVSTRRRRTSPVLLHNQRGTDQGSIIAIVLVLGVILAGIGLVATLAVERTLRADSRAERQTDIDRLAASAGEEVFGRLAASSSSSLDAVTSHPGYGTGTDADTGPWVRFGIDGQVVNCTSDAREACFTVRLNPYPSLAAARSAILQVTARRCQAATVTTSACTRARQQITLRARDVAPGVLWVGTIADTAAFVNDEVLAGPVQVNNDGVPACGTSTLGRTVADVGSGGSRYRLAVAGSTAVTTPASCTAVTTPTVTSSVVDGADVLTLPGPSATDLAQIAGRTVTQTSGGAAVTVEVRGTRIKVNGGSPEDLPAHGLLWVDGDVTVTMADGMPLRGRLTIAASGDVSVESDLLLASTTDDFLGVVSTGGNITVAFAGVPRVIQALLVATASSSKGKISATGYEGCTVPPCTATLTVFGALVARQLGAFATSDTDGLITEGFTRTLEFDSRLAVQQPPYAVEAVRGVWMRLESAFTAPAAPGIG